MSREITSKNIDGVSDLVVWAPIKEGFIHAFENVTYETRLRIVGEALHKVRVAAREHSEITPYSDTAERILSLLDFRIGIVDRNLSETEFTNDGEADQISAIIKPTKYLYLSATFGGSLEPYMRLIWKPLGPFLDLLFCNCEGYVPASENSFPDYLKWVRDNQLDSALFYSTTGLTVKDHLYLQKLEKMQRGAITAKNPSGDIDFDIARMTMDDPEKLAEKVRTFNNGNDPENRHQKEVLRLSLEALTVLHKLANYYPPDQLKPETCEEARKRCGDPMDPNPGDGRFLLRATESLLEGFDPRRIPPDVVKRYNEPLNWFERRKAAKPELQQCEDPKPSRTDVQKGILSSYAQYTDENGLEQGTGISHGVLLFFKVVDPKCAREWIKKTAAQYVNWEDETGFPGQMFGNIGFTYKGLERLGFAEDDLMALPKEFREGMEERSGLLGDYRENHPRNWTLPARNWLSNNDGKEESLPRPPVEMSEVDFVLQLRSSVELVSSLPSASHQSSADTVAVRNTAVAREKSLVDDFEHIDFREYAIEKFYRDPRDTNPPSSPNVFHPLSEAIAAIGVDADETGIQLVTVESMNGFPDEITRDKELDPASEATTDHFGFRDGISQPKHVFGKKEDDVGPGYDETVRMGELLLGFENERGDSAPCEHAKHKPEPGCKNTSIAHQNFPTYFTNSSFQVIRKIDQHVDRFHEQFGLNEDKCEIDEETAARFVGRHRDGRPLIEDDVDNPIGDGLNDFTYSNDEEGVACPFASHIRRTNPRDSFHGRRNPRILRRGMSYGPRYKQRKNGEHEQTPIEDDKPRGIMFMAFNASIAEQYETIQRWINGGNSTNISSAQNDPLIGIDPKDGVKPDLETGFGPLEKRIFRFIMPSAAKDQKPEVKSVAINKPLTTLQWGLYLFIPSKPALAEIVDDERVQTSTRRSRENRASAGRSAIKDIEALPAKAKQAKWKSILEDFLTKDPSEKSQSPNVWRAIRGKEHNGVYRLPFLANRHIGWSNIVFLNAPFILAQLLHLYNFFGRYLTRVSNRFLPDLAEDDGCEESDENLSIVLVADKEQITQVLSDHRNFSVSEQSKRVNKSFGDIYVAQDPGEQYRAESQITNEIIWEYSEYCDEDAYLKAYGSAEKVLKTAKSFSKTDSFKMELRRELIMPSLGGLCELWFDIPDMKSDLVEQFIELGGWGWEPVHSSQADSDSSNLRKSRCPGDFMAPSRFSFYPRPTRTIRDYGIAHGRALREASLKVVNKYRQNGGPDLGGIISKQMYDKIPDTEKGNDLLARNLIGIMEGMLPPTDGLLRGILFEWLTEETLWKNQAELHRQSGNNPATFAQAKAALEIPVKKAICKRPSPDLIYRTVARHCQKIGRQRVEKGDQVILGLVSAMQQSLEDYEDPDISSKCPVSGHDVGPDISMVFGGNRKAAEQAEGDPAHACPAQKMVMASTMGILAALLDSGRIQAQPASLIVKISDYKPVP